MTASSETADWTAVTTLEALRRNGLVEACVGSRVIVLAWVEGAPWQIEGFRLYPVRVTGGDVEVEVRAIAGDRRPLRGERPF